ncbi:MAG: ROK family protein [Sphingobacteriales bacterium]|nr:ROK family protein [Sphingobacteriales bacterium]
MKTNKAENFLAIDIGGSHIKATVLHPNGEMQFDYKKIETPEKATPQLLIDAIKTLLQDFPSFDKISVGFPGYVKDGVIFTAPNLDSEAWKNFNLSKALSNEFKKPVRLVNDADLQGLAVISRKGLEMVITLGTGFGTALFMDGKLLPHLELAHLPVRKNKDYDAFIGDKALIQDGEEKWNKKMKEVLNTFKTVINYDRLYLSGGNAKKISFKLDDNIKIVSNKDGIKGGAFLWHASDGYCVKSVHPDE